MSADPNAVDTAIIGLLLGDAELLALMPGGVWFEHSQSPETRFVLVRLLGHHSEPQFGGSAYEIHRYEITAVEKDTSGPNSRSAAARLHALLEGALTISGYQHMLTEWASRVRFAEPDVGDPAIRWEHCGGQYDVWVAPLVAPALLNQH